MLVLVGNVIRTLGQGADHEKENGEEPGADGDCGFTTPVICGVGTG